MPCYRPMDCWRQPGALKPGEKRIVFSRHDPIATPLTVPCGQCIGCRLERSRRWAVRIMHEASLHDANSFLTLTYSPENVPTDGSLRVEDFQNFMKRLRRGSSSPLRFFHCGEYGETTRRPHYHCCLFGEDFRSDRELVKRTERGDSLFESPRLTETWGLGHAWIGDLTFESAAYVARYCLKKITGDKAEAHYQGRRPEYVTMSRRPGIGAPWLLQDRNLFETYRDDTVIMRGREMMPPPAYDKLLEKIDPALFARVKKSRSEEAGDFYDSPDNYSGRLVVREEVKESTAENCLKRKI